MKNDLKHLRKSKGYTQIALQMKTGIEQALLSKFENGQHPHFCFQRYDVLCTCRNSRKDTQLTKKPHRKKFRCGF